MRDYIVEDFLALVDCFNKGGIELVEELVNYTNIEDEIEYPLQDKEILDKEVVRIGKVNSVLTEMQYIIPKVLNDIPENKILPLGNKEDLIKNTKKYLSDLKEDFRLNYSTGLKTLYSKEDSKIVYPNMPLNNKIIFKLYLDTLREVGVIKK